MFTQAKQEKTGEVKAADVKQEHTVPSLSAADEPLGWSHTRMTHIVTVLHWNVVFVFFVCKYF